MITLLVSMSLATQNRVATVRCEPVSAWVNNLSAASGKQLTCSTDLTPRIVFISSSDGATGNLKVALASALGARWEITKSGERLTRIAGFARDQNRLAEQKLRTRIGVALQALAATQPKPESAAWYARSLLSMSRFKDGIQTGRDQKDGTIPPLELPCDFLVKALMQAMDPDELAKLPMNRSVVYSTIPTAAQREFTFKMKELITPFRQSEELLRGAAEFNWTFPSTFDKYGLGLVRQALEESPADKINLFVRRDVKNVSFLLTTYTKTGKQRTTGSGIISVLPAKVAQHQADSKVPVPKLFADLCRLSVGGNQPLSTEKEALLDFVTLRSTPEPLSVGIPEAISAIVGPRPLVAWLGDDVLDAAVHALHDDTISRNEFASALFARYSQSDENGWKVIRPIDPESSMLRTIDRSYFSRFVSAVRGKTAGLREICVLSAASDTSLFDKPVFTLFSPAISRLGYSVPESSMGAWMTRFLGSLSDESWKSLVAGNPLELRGCSEQAVSELSDWATLGPTVLDTKNSDVPDIYRNITDAFPQGFPPDSTVTTDTRYYNVMSKVLDNGDLAMPIGYAHVGDHIAEAIRIGSIKSPSEFFPYRYRLGQMKSLNFTIRFTHGLEFHSSTGGGTSYEPTNETYTWATLPKAVKQAIEDSVKQAQTSG